MMDLNSEKSIIESWDIYRRKENKNRIYEARNSFIIDIKKIFLNQFMQ